MRARGEVQGNGEGAQKARVDSSSSGNVPMLWCLFCFLEDFPCSRVDGGTIKDQNKHARIFHVHGPVPSALLHAQATI